MVKAIIHHRSQNILDLFLSFVFYFYYNYYYYCGYWYCMITCHIGTSSHGCSLQPVVYIFDICTIFVLSCSRRPVT